MQSGITGHVNPAEWRWVFVVSILLVGLAFVPFLWFVINNDADSTWQFMGALHGHVESSAYISRIQQGMRGDVLVQFMHTPEAHSGFILQPIYPLLGQVSRFAADNLSPILVFHVARVSVTVFMYMTLYQLAATIWTRVRTRRVFFVLVSVGSGLGWVSLVTAQLTGIRNVPIDLAYVHLSPFYSGLVSIHVPLAIACMALLGAIIISEFRPGVTTLPTVRNSGVIAFALGIVLVLMDAEAYVTIAIALIITILAHWYFAKKITNRELLWMLWTLVPALPFLIYNILIIRSNPFVQEWIRQRAEYHVDPIQLILALGVMLWIGIPSIIRAVRYFESDSDRFMIIWLLVSCFGVFVPIDIRVYFLVGVMIPIAYFATRSIEDVWIKYIARRYRTLVFSFLAVFLMISNLVVLLTPLIPLMSSNPSNSAGMILSQEYGVALGWLNPRTNSSDVVLASPEVSSWIPVWLGSHSVAGHPYETMTSREKVADVTEFYNYDSDDCDSAYRRIDGFEQAYTVRYLIYGPMERKLGDGICQDAVIFMASFGEVEIYQLLTQYPR